MQRRLKTPFAVKRSGIRIEDYRIKNSVQAGITYSQGFLEFEAAQEAGLDLWKWYMNYYNNKFKAKIIAWYKYHNLVKAHAEDAASLQAERNAKRKKK